MTDSPAVTASVPAGISTLLEEEIRRQLDRPAVIASVPNTI